MTTVAEQFIEQRGKLVRAYIQPTRVTFSPHGYAKAMREHDRNSSPMFGAYASGEPTQYMGLPFRIVDSQECNILVGSTCETPPIMKVSKIGLSLGFNPSTGEVLVDGKAYDEPINILELIGKSLSAAQLCDIIMSWLGNDSNWGDFEKALHKAVEDSGSFE